MDFVHRASALITALTLVFGTYAFADWDTVRPVLADVRDMTRHVAENADSIFDPQRVVRVAADPSQLAAAAFSVPLSLESLARKFNATVDEFVFGVVFSNVALSEPGRVQVSVGPAVPSQPAPVRGGTAVSTPASDAPAPQAVRYVEVPRAASVSIANVTKAYVDQGLISLRSEFLTRLIAMENANSTSFRSVAASAGGSSIDTANVAFTGGTISGVTITGGSVTATAFSGTLPIANGGTALATAPSYGQLLVGDGAGGYTLSATSSLGIIGTADGAFSTTSASYFSSIGLAFSTSSTDAWKSERNFFSTTSAIFFADASTTIPKTYSTNTWTALQTFSNASTSNISASYASSTLYFGAGLANCNSENMLTWTDGRFGCESDTSGGGSSFSYLFPSDATTTKLTFSSGLLSLASTTIGAGGQATGLTISGGATTTGNAYFGGNVGIGTQSPGYGLHVVGSALITGGGSGAHMIGFGSGDLYLITQAR